MCNPGQVRTCQVGLLVNMWFTDTQLKIDELTIVTEITVVLGAPWSMYASVGDCQSSLHSSPLFYVILAVYLI